MIRALVVDDNEVNTMILANMLELFQIQAEQADGGSRALELAKCSAYDLVFVDHIMPEMNGLETVQAFRKLDQEFLKPVIIALSSTVSEPVSRQYREFGANAVYAKPLSLTQLTSLLKIYFPDYVFSKLPNIKTRKAASLHSDIKALINEVQELDFEAGLKYTVGNPAQYMNILKVSLKDLEVGINSISKSLENHTTDLLRLSLHNLKSVFTNIGALGLSEHAKWLELLLTENRISEAENDSIKFLTGLKEFRKKLVKTLENYKEMSRSEFENRESTTVKMTKEEYEQSIQSAIYYIKRYEFDAIIKALELLLLSGQEADRQEFEAALSEVKLFEYEKALARLTNINK